MNVYRAEDPRTLRHGVKARIAGCVIARQRPGTAHGFIFLSIEDDRPAPEILNIMRSLEGQGMSYRAIGRELNQLNIRTGRGCEWLSTDFWSARRLMPSRNPVATRYTATHITVGTGAR
jgi:hypothetical protein